MQRPVVPPAHQTPSNRTYYQPPTIQSDYTNQLWEDHPHFTETFGLVHSWFRYQSRVGYAHVDESIASEEPLYIRATYFPVDWKSKVGNSDASANFKTDWVNPIWKGDYIIREHGEILLLTWDIKEHMNNQATQAQICNQKLTLVRHVQATADARGFIETPAHDEIILLDHPATFTPYAGRPDYIATANVPGINADSLMSGQIQFNEQTKKITINDEFEYGGFTYRLTNVDWSEVNYDNTAGIINFNCKRVAGGMYAPN